MDLKGRRQSENVHRQIVPMLSRFSWLDPIMAIQAGIPAAANAILHPALGPKPAISKAMEDAAYRDRLEIQSRERQRGMPSPFGDPGDPPWTKERIREVRRAGWDAQRRREAEEVRVLATSIVAEQAHADFLRQTAPKPVGRGRRR